MREKVISRLFVDSGPSIRFMLAYGYSIRISDQIRPFLKTFCFLSPTLQSPSRVLKKGEFARDITSTSSKSGTKMNICPRPVKTHKRILSLTGKGRNCM